MKHKKGTPKHRLSNKIILTWIHQIHNKVFWQQNKYIRLSVKFKLFHMCVLHPFSVFLHVYSVLFLFYSTTCVWVCTHIYCGNPFEPGASRLPYYCTSICVRSWCNLPASCVDSKTKQMTAAYPGTTKKQSKYNPPPGPGPRGALEHKFKHINHFKIKSICPRSNAGVPLDSVGRFRATLLLCTTCICSCCTWIPSCMAAYQTQKPKNLNTIVHELCWAKLDVFSLKTLFL